MRKIVGLIFIVILSYSTSAQEKCELSKLSKKSRTELTLFWNELITVLQQNDTNKMASFCHLPFVIPKEYFTKEPLDTDNYRLDSEMIVRYIPFIFFDNYFKMAVSQYSDPTKCLISHGSYNNKEKTCAYIFCYLFKNNLGLNEERCFSIVKYADSYKFDFCWIRH